jgi:hypothetical protein
MRYLRSKRGLKVNGLGNSIYIAWIPNYYGLIPPRLRYRHELNGDLEYIKSEGHIKAIGINSLGWNVGIAIVTIIDSGGHFDFFEMYPFFLGVIGFMLLLDLLLTEITKWKVEKQRRANNAS